jgi:hypothetical protein
MGVFRDVSIPFGGREYVVTPSNRVLRLIEIKGRRDDPSFNIMAVFYRATTGMGGLNELAFALAEFINSAGGKATEDDAYAEMMRFQDPADLRAYIELICSLVMPEPKDDDVKKQEAPPQAEK